MDDASMDADSLHLTLVEDFNTTDEIGAPRFFSALVLYLLQHMQT